MDRPVPDAKGQSTWDLNGSAIPDANGVVHTSPGQRPGLSATHEGWER